MKKYLLFFLLFVPFINWSQTYSEGWENTTVVGWTQEVGTFNVTNQLPCFGSNSIRTRLQGNTTMGTAILVNPTKIFVTNGGLITFSFDYKWLLNNGNILVNPVGAQGNRLDLKWQWSNKINGPWYTFESVDVTNHVVSSQCAKMSTTFAAYPGDLFIRVVASNTSATGDDFLYIDNLSAVEDPNPATCGLPRNVNISNKSQTGFTINWSAPTTGSTPISYDWEVRTSGKPGSGNTGRIDGANNVTTLSVNTAVPLAPGTLYKVYVRANCVSPSNNSWIGIESVTFCPWPTLTTTTNITVCGIQPLELTANTNGSVFWFNKDHDLVGTNAILSIPEVTESAKYHVFSGITNATTNSLITIGAGIAANSTGVPFGNTKASKVQYIYLASELKAAGFSQGVIKSLGIKTTNGGTLQRNRFNIHMGLTSLEQFSDTNFIPNTRLQEVKTVGDQTLVANDVNMFDLDTPFIWDGYSNIIVQFTYSESTNTVPGTTQTVSTNMGANTYRTLYASSTTLDHNGMSGVSTGTTSDVRINAYMDILDGCFGPGVIVNVNFKDAPVLNLSGDIVNNCIGSPLTKLYVLTGAGDYDNYEWTVTDPNDPAANDTNHPNHPANAIKGSQTTGWTFETTVNMSYTLRASSSIGDKCVITKVINVENNSAPQIQQLQNDYKLCTSVVQELKVDDFVNETPTKYLFNGNLNGVTLLNAVSGDAISNDTSMFSEGTGSLKINYAAQTNAMLQYDAALNTKNLKSIVVEFDHIAALQSNTTGVMDYAFLEYSVNNGASWKPFLPENYTGSANKTLSKPISNSSFLGMFFTRTSYTDWGAIQSTTIPATVPWKSEKFVVPATDLTSNGTFKIRFRIGADGNDQFPGWLIDNVKITPISNNQITWTPIANLYYDQNATKPYDGNINSGTLYLKGANNSSNVLYKVEVTNQYGCKAEKSFTVSIGLDELPVVHNINSCSVVNVGSINFGKNVNGVLSYYDSLTSNTPITQITTSGTYYVEQLISGCKSARVSFAVVISSQPPVPTSNSSQTFCGNATVNDLTYNAVPGFQLNWYLTSTGGTALASTAPINNGTYYGEFTNGFCTSIIRVAVNVSIGVTPPSISMSNVYICGISTIADIKVNAIPGATVNWYQNINDITPLPNTTVLLTGTYYIAQKTNSCESAKTPVSVSSVQNLNMPNAATVQTFCASATVANLTATATSAGANVFWYGFSTSDTPLSNTTPLVTGTYYVGQSIGDCDSPKRAVSVRILSVNAPIINPIDLCGDVTVASIPLNPTTGSTYNVYVSAFATTEMGQNDIINSGTYYISKVENGCETARAAVYITVTARPTSPTGNVDQEFKNYAEVKDLKANEPNVVWFESYNDAINNNNPLPFNHPLQDGKTYYGVIIGQGGCSSLPFAVKVKIALGLNDLDLASLKYYPNPVNSELTVTYKDPIKLIEVYDLLGKQVKVQKFDSTDVRVDVSSLSSGTYMMRVQTDSGSQFIKVIKN